MSINIEALRELRRVVAAVDPKKFDIRVWWENRERYGFLNLLVKPECGCLVGHAMHDAWFQERGLVPKGGYTGPRNKVPALVDSDGSVSLTTWPAVRKFFGVTLAEGKHLFDADTYIEDRGPEAKAEALRRIDSMIERAVEKEAAAKAELVRRNVEAGFDRVTGVTAPGKPLPAQLTALLGE